MSSLFGWVFGVIVIGFGVIAIWWLIRELDRLLPSATPRPARVVTYSDQTELGTFAQLRFASGERVLLSFTRVEFAMLELDESGHAPLSTTFKVPVIRLLDAVPRESLQDNSPLEIVVEAVRPAGSIQEATATLEYLVAGTNASVDT